MLTNKERVRRSLQHLDSDIVPYQISLTSDAYDKMVQYYKDKDTEEAVLFPNIGSHLLGLGRAELPDKSGVPQPGFYRDDFGVVWDRTRDRDIGVIHDFIVNPDNLDSYEFPDPKDPRSYAYINDALKANKDQFTIGSIGFSFFERAWTLRGMENLLMDFADNSAFVNKFFDRIMYWLLDVVEEFNKFDEIDAIYFGDDWGQQHGLIMGPGYWREYLKPRLKVIYAAAKSTGKFVTIHSCGDIKEVIPDLIEIGLDMFNPFQPEVMDVYEMKRLYGDKLSFHGGISLQKTLVFGTPEDVRREVLERMAIVGKSGGYIVDACHGITRDVPAENIDMLIRTVRRQEPRAY